MEPHQPAQHIVFKASFFQHIRIFIIMAPVTLVAFMEFILEFQAILYIFIGLGITILLTLISILKTKIFDLELTPYGIIRHGFFKESITPWVDIESIFEEKGPILDAVRISLYPDKRTPVQRFFRFLSKNQRPVIDFDLHLTDTYDTPLQKIIKTMHTFHMTYGLTPPSRVTEQCDLQRVDVSKKDA